VFAVENVGSNVEPLRALDVVLGLHRVREGPVRGRWRRAWPLYPRGRARAPCIRHRRHPDRRVAVSNPRCRLTDQTALHTGWGVSHRRRGADHTGALFAGPGRGSSCGYTARFLSGRARSTYEKTSPEEVRNDAEPAVGGAKGALSEEQRQRSPGATPSLEESRDLDEHWGDVTGEPGGVDYLEIDAGGVPAMRAVPHAAGDDRVLLCLHGGGFVAARCTPTASCSATWPSPWAPCRSSGSGRSRGRGLRRDHARDGCRCRSLPDMRGSRDAAPRWAGAVNVWMSPGVSSRERPSGL
jgi:hypothetical protein